MKKYILIVLYITFISSITSCSNPVKRKLKGNWHAKDGVTKLYITERDFTLDDGEAIAEDYFINGDTIFTSFQGNQPYTNFVVQKLEDHYLKLMGPDSIVVEYSR